MALLHMSYLLRVAAFFGILLVCVKSGYCNAIAAVVPLLFTRPTITLAEFFRKPGETQS